VLKKKSESGRECCHAAKLNYPLQWTWKTQAIPSGQRFKPRHSKQRLKVLYNPSLRKRNEDIGLPVDYFVQKISKQLPNVIESIPAAALDAQ
jgi:transcriptional regulator with PAS, ATPase and Fis domain